MKKYLFALPVLYLASLSVFQYGKTHSFFTESSTSAVNLIAAAQTFPTTPITPSLTPMNTPTATPTLTSTSTNHIVISEVQIHGANANHDFVELYNPTNSDVNLNGWQLNKKISSGTSSSLVLIGSGKSIKAHGFFLWANSEGGYSASINSDVSNGNYITENNSIELENQTNTIIDKVAWGNGSNQYIEGLSFPNNPATNQSIERKAFSGSTTITMGSGGIDQNNGNSFDSDNNSTDFILRTLSNPQNSSSAVEIP